MSVKLTKDQTLLSHTKYMCYGKFPRIKKSIKQEENTKVFYSPKCIYSYLIPIKIEQIFYYTHITSGLIYNWFIIAKVNFFIEPNLLCLISIMLLMVSHVSMISFNYLCAGWTDCVLLSRNNYLYGILSLLFAVFEKFIVFLSIVWNEIFVSKEEADMWDNLLQLNVLNYGFVLRVEVKESWSFWNSS